MTTVGPNTPFTPPDSPQPSENTPQKTPKKGAKDLESVKIPTHETTSDRPKMLRSIGNKIEKENLQKTAEKIKKLDSPLLPMKGRDVYFLNTDATNPHSVFKPGKTNTVKAILCQKVAKLLGLEKSVLKTIEATASELVSHIDLDDDDQPITYEKARVNNEDWLINTRDSYSISFYIQEEDGLHVKLQDGTRAILVVDPAGYKIAKIEEGSDNYFDDNVVSGDEGDIFYESDEDGQEAIIRNDEVPEDDSQEDSIRNDSIQDDSLQNDSLQDELVDCDLEVNDIVVIATVDDEDFLVPQQSAHPVTSEPDSPHVLRGDTRYELRQSQSSDEGKMLVGKDVKGLLQPMVQDVVTEVGGQTVNILKPSKIRDAFYSMINPISFIDSIVLATLFITRDGKASELDDTNFLFTKENDKLNLTLIDLDETWPSTNDYTNDPDFTKNIEGKITSLRLGLMGYPHAHEVLKGEQREHVVQLLANISQKYDQLLATFDKYPPTRETELEDCKNSFKDVLDRLKSFDTNKDFALSDLVFHVFPEYHAQWQQLEKIGLPREEIASWLGFSSVEEVIKARTRNKR